MRAKLGHLFKALALGVALVALAEGCANVEDFNHSGESYYMPDVDLFVVRGPSDPESNVDPARFDMTGDEADYLQDIFQGKTDRDVNGWLDMLGVAFYHSRIRIFYIRYDPLDSDSTNLTSDFNDLTYSTEFTLTDKDNSGDKGTVYNEEGPLKIFFMGDTSDGADFAGLGWVGAKGVLIVNKGNDIGQQSMSVLLAHELGHNFGLVHPFEDATGEPNSGSCDPAQLGSTNRVMDYSPNKETFAPCERMIAEFYGYKSFFYNKIPYDPNRGPQFELYKGEWSGQKIIGSPAAANHAASAAPLIKDKLHWFE